MSIESEREESKCGVHLAGGEEGRSWRKGCSTVLVCICCCGPCAELGALDWERLMCDLDAYIVEWTAHSQGSTIEQSDQSAGHADTRVEAHVPALVILLDGILVLNYRFARPSPNPA